MSVLKITKEKSIPTLVVMKEGKVVKSTVGVQSKQTLLSMLQ